MSTDTDAAASADESDPSVQSSEGEAESESEAEAVDDNGTCSAGEPPLNNLGDFSYTDDNNTESESESDVAEEVEIPTSTTASNNDSSGSSTNSNQRRSDMSYEADYINGVHRLKCTRRAKWEERLTCGYGMIGSDFPEIDVNKLLPETIAPDVEAQVQQYMATHGIEGLKPGKVFFGSTTAYRIVKIRGQEVLFSKLEENDRVSLIGKMRQRSMFCHPNVGIHVFKRICNRELFDRVVD